MGPTTKITLGGNYPKKKFKRKEEAPREKKIAPGTMDVYRDPDYETDYGRRPYPDQKPGYHDPKPVPDTKGKPALPPLKEMLKKRFGR